MDKFKKQDVVALYKSFESDKDNSFFVDPETGHFAFRGVVSNEEMDRDGDIVTAKAMAEATKEYLEFGSLREMHSYDNVVGKVKKVWQEGKKTFIEAFVVDPLTVEKIKTKVLTGLSIGFCVLERDEKNKNIFTKIKWFETSVVDIPSNYSAHIAAKNAKIKIEEESMEKENENKNVAEIEATKEKPAETSTDTKVEVDTVKVESNQEDLQALNDEAVEILEAELNKVKAELEAVTKTKNELELEVKSFEKTKEVAKSFKSLNLVHEKFKQENASLKLKVAELEAEVIELKSKEVNIKTATPEDVKEKSVDFSKFEVKQAPAEVYNATAILKAKLFKE